MQLDLFYLDCDTYVLQMSGPSFSQTELMKLLLNQVALSISSLLFSPSLGPFTTPKACFPLQGCSFFHLAQASWQRSGR